MLQKSDIDAFLLEQSNKESVKSTRYEYFTRMAKKFNGKNGDEALSHLIEYLYTHEFEYLTESLCIKVLKNFQFYNSKQKTYERKFVDLPDYDSIDSLRTNELREDAEKIINRSEWKTFYATELAIEGRLDDEDIERLEKLRAASSRLPLWASNIYKMHLIEGLTIRAISEKVGIPVTSVFLKIKKMKELLLEDLKNEENLW